MKLIRSRDNPLVKSLLKLGSSSRERHRSGLTLLDGVHLLEAWRDAGRGEAEIVAVSEEALERPDIRKLVESTPARTGVVLSASLMKQVSQVVTSAGIVAAVKTPHPGPLPSEIGDGVFLERIQDPGNLGTVLRTALAAGIRHVFSSPGSVAAWSPKAVRGGMGAHFGLSIFEDVEAAAITQRCRGIVVATGPGSGRPIYDSDLRRPVLWLFGSEGEGLSGDAAGLAHERLSVPMSGQVQSLNLPASVAVCLFEQRRQRTQ